MEGPPESRIQTKSGPTSPFTRTTSHATQQRPTLRQHNRRRTVPSTETNAGNPTAGDSPSPDATRARMPCAMKSHDALNSDDVKEAQREATRGAVMGAVKWGIASAALGGVGYHFWPVYRGLTVQFKVYLQMSGMILGSMIEADSRMRQYETRVRLQRRIARDRAMWETFEKEYEEEGGPAPPPRPKHLRQEEHQ
ncbi:hypothetical protein JX265_011808 [Neoarthrinium moseri]|uniref:Imidazoleglycerol-phosphate dehydratase n=1 Tax=Neoarthrinium moseri TaxID=1658444 RepID=A0A9Q0AJ86_9PEZI|nr:uncharacterized protein JN550_013475 [Neoarthrinium moseri]KAI1856093.1 hypothetical protein JX265_011808 [Neoarthrinium moseri]KAI1857031.1 hypothetical protein JN550_013475 [Neoarthrinium moseri]